MMIVLVWFILVFNVFRYTKKLLEEGMKMSPNSLSLYLCSWNRMGL